MRGREEKIRPRQKAERQRGQEVVGGTPGLPNTPAGLRSSCMWFLGGPGHGPVILWDWGCGPCIFMGLGLAPLSPGGGSGSTAPASLHLTEGSAHPSSRVLGQGDVGKRCHSWHRAAFLAFLLSTFLLILQKFLISSVALPGRQAHIWSYGGKRTALPASGQFSPLRASSLAGCRSNLTLGGEGMGGAGAGATQSLWFHPENHGLDIF